MEKTVQVPAELESRFSGLADGRDKLILIYDAATYRGAVLESFRALLQKSFPLIERRPRRAASKPKPEGNENAR